MMEELKNILAQPESAETWNQLIDYLDNWTDTNTLATAIKYAQRKLEFWSDELRKAPANFWQAIQNGAPIPHWWKLVRYLDIEENDQLLKSFITEALENITSIKLIDCYLKPEELFLLARLNKLACLNWFDLIDSLDEWPENKPITEILELAETQLKDCSDESRKAPKQDWQAIKNGASIPRWWKLVRFLKLEENDHEIQPLEAFIYLTKLDASEARFVDIEDLAKLTNLSHLSLVEDLLSFGIAPITKITKLKHLKLSILELTDLEGLRNLENLEFLDLSYNTDLVEIDDLAFLPKLNYLDLSYCESLQDISPLANLQNLQTLYLNGCSNIKDFSPLAKLYNCYIYNEEELMGVIG